MTLTRRECLIYGGSFLAGALLPGCQRSKSDKPVIALVMKSLANEFFVTMEKGARDHHEKHKAEYELIADGTQNEEESTPQIHLVERMLARANAIVLAPADSKALVAVCKKAHDAGIVVVNIDNQLDAGVLAAQKLKIPFVGPDNRKGARLAGEYLARHLKAGDAVAIVEGVPTAYNAIQRKLGFEDAMKAAGMTIADSQSANWELSQADKLVGAMMSANPNLKAILCANDSMALGAVAALKGKAGEVKVIGFDNISAVQQAIKQGKVLATVDQHGDQLAVFGIEYALEILKKKTTPADKETPVDLITAETLK